VYTRDGIAPLNGAPVAVTQYERAGVTFGKEECFEVRSVLRVGTVDLESEPVPICVTPRDTFPPAEPKGLSVVAGDGTMKLSWDANAEADLAGYLVLRGEAPSETLQPLASAPLSGTSFEDKTVKPGVRYVYAVAAVDKATPPNTSKPSPRVEETAR
jgi:fibronectin type 3 domain-containing protein